jgi:hypothetical protein
MPISIDPAWAINAGLAGILMWVIGLLITGKLRTSQEMEAHQKVATVVQETAKSRIDRAEKQVDDLVPLIKDDLVPLIKDELVPLVKQSVERSDKILEQQTELVKEFLVELRRRPA